MAFTVEQVADRLKNNEKMIELLNLSNKEIQDRYVLDQEPSQSPLQRFKSAVDKQDEKGYLVNYNLSDLEGVNLNYIAKKVCTFTSKMARKQIYVNIDQIVDDFELIISEFENEIGQYIRELPSSVAENNSDENADFHKFVGDPKDYVIFCLNQYFTDIINNKFLNEYNLSV